MRLTAACRAALPPLEASLRRKKHPDELRASLRPQRCRMLARRMAKAWRGQCRDGKRLRGAIFEKRDLGREVGAKISFQHENDSAIAGYGKNSFLFPVSRCSLDQRARNQVSRPDDVPRPGLPGQARAMT